MDVVLTITSERSHVPPVDMLPVLALSLGSHRNLGVHALDTISQTWSTGPHLATPRSEHSCVVVGSLLYVIGGCDADDE